MRILFVCDSYPPFDKGGYAQLCYDLAHELRAREHDVLVLCAESDKSIHEVEPVIRGLRTPIHFQDRYPIPVQQLLFAKSRAAFSEKLFKQTLDEYKPQVVVFWPAEYVDRHLMQIAESEEKTLVTYYLAGYSPTQPSILKEYWLEPGRSRSARIAKSLLRHFLSNYANENIALKLEHVMCVSQYERQRVIHHGINPDHAIVIYNGIDLNQFKFAGLPSERRATQKALRVLYAGRLVEEKGAHTVVEAVNLLRLNKVDVPVDLTVLGTGPAAYTQQLDRLISTHGLQDAIHRQEWIQREQMPAFMAQFDVCVLPTIHPEPLARAVQEAMAIGLVVIATTTGGTPEAVIDNETGLTFSAGNAAELAVCLSTLYEEINRCDRLVSKARELVASQFTIQQMAERTQEQFSEWLAQIQ